MIAASPLLRRPGALLAAVPVVLFAVLRLFDMALVATQPRTVWVDTLADDAYYYLAIARHIAIDGISSYAPPMPTNGYQPLWQGVLAALAWLTGGDRAVLAGAVHGLTLVCGVAFMALARRLHGAAWPAATVLLVLPMVTSAGMETTLIAPLALLWWASRDWKWRGALSALLFLGRLDSLGLIAGRALWDLLRERRIDWRAHGVLLAVIAVYAGANLIGFGTPVPISGLAKAVGSVLGENLPTGAGLLVEAAPALLAMVIAAACARIDRTGLRFAAQLFAASAALLASALYYGLFSGWPLWGWYAWPVALLLYFTLAELAAALRETPISARARLWRLAALVVLAMGFAHALQAYVYRYFPATRALRGMAVPVQSFGQINAVMAGSLNRGAPSGLRLAMGDRAGSLGYFLDDRFVFFQTEGIVGSRAYLEALRADRGGAALDAFAPDLLVVDNPGLPLMYGDVAAVLEPSQGLSMRVGHYLVCFPRGAELAPGALGYPVGERHVYRYRQRVACPAAARNWLADYAAHYRGRWQWRGID